MQDLFVSQPFRYKTPSNAISPVINHPNSVDSQRLDSRVELKESQLSLPSKYVQSEFTMNYIHMSQAK